MKIVPLPDYESLYSIAEDGAIRSLKTGRALTQFQDSNGYPKVNTRINNKTLNLYVHRCLARAFLGCNKSDGVDHKDGNPSNNSLDNLRIANQSLNAFNGKLRSTNTSGIRGVSFVPKRNRWLAQIKFKYRSIFLGHFKYKNEALRARKSAEIKYFGEFAPSR